MAVLAAAGCGQGGGQAAKPPPMKIPVVEAIQRDVPVTLELVGQTRGSRDIPIRARLQGFLESMSFTEGGPVEEGQLLYTIDPRPFEAKVVEAQGLAAEAKTQVAKARADLERIRPLAEIRAVSEQDLDGAVAAYEASRAKLQAMQARLEQAEIELGYTRIYSPIEGLIGITQAKVGEFVGATPNPVILNFVSVTDPIRVRFAINERDYLRFARRQAKRLSSAPGGQAPPDDDRGLDMILADGSIHPYRGDVVAFDAAINPTTGTFTIEADFPNPDSIVLAGQFARVRGVIEVREDAVLVPRVAISELQGLFRVFVVLDDGTVKLRTVELGPVSGNLQVVESGVDAGEKVAVEGLLRLTNDAKVIPELRPVDEPSSAPNLGN
jgi:membrane fusion protein (multidrug efflux system)